MAGGTGPGGVIDGCWAKPEKAKNKAKQAKQAKRRHPRPIRLIWNYLLRTKYTPLGSSRGAENTASMAATKIAEGRLRRRPYPEGKMWFLGHIKGFGEKRR